jgi:hypothetical protein
VLAVEKIVQSKLLVKGANRRIMSLDNHVGMVSSAAAILRPGHDDSFTVHVLITSPLTRFRQVCWQTAGISPSGEGKKHRVSVINMERQ